MPRVARADDSYVDRGIGEGPCDRQLAHSVPSVAGEALELHDGGQIELEYLTLEEWTVGPPIVRPERPRALGGVGY